MLFSISRSTTHHVFHTTAGPILKNIKPTGIPFDDIGELKKLSKWFIQSQSPLSRLGGCIGAIDGIYDKIMKPKDS